MVSRALYGTSVTGGILGFLGLGGLIGAAVKGGDSGCSVGVVCRMGLKDTGETTE